MFRYLFAMIAWLVVLCLLRHYEKIHADLFWLNIVALAMLFAAFVVFLITEVGRLGDEE